MSKTEAYFLAIDFGNTRKKLALFTRSGTIYARQFLDLANWQEQIINLLDAHNIYRTALSTVVPVPADFVDFLRAKTELILIGQTEIPQALKMPKTFIGRMGADRIGLALGAISQKLNQNYLIISMGTCITYNFINSHNYFLGGSISVGLNMRFRALNQFTAQLPLFSHEDIDLSKLTLVGYDTHTHIVSGIVQGIIKELEGMIAQYQRDYSELSCIISGGDSPLFAKLYSNGLFCPPIIPKFDADLLFNGLFHFYGA